MKVQNDVTKYIQNVDITVCSLYMDGTFHPATGHKINENKNGKYCEEKFNKEILLYIKLHSSVSIFRKKNSFQNSNRF